MTGTERPLSPLVLRAEENEIKITPQPELKGVEKGRGHGIKAKIIPLGICVCVTEGGAFGGGARLSLTAYRCYKKETNCSKAFQIIKVKKQRANLGWGRRRKTTLVTF